MYIIIYGMYILIIGLILFFIKWNILKIGMYYVFIKYLIKFKNDLYKYVGGGGCNIYFGSYVFGVGYLVLII